MRPPRRWGRALAFTILVGARASLAASPGEMVYKTYCALCHQQDGAGLSGQFPRLKGRLGPMLAQPATRRYAIEVILNGMAGSIQVDDSRIVGVMPPLRTVSDPEIAAVLAYVANLDGAPHGKPVSAAEVAGVRTADPLSATDMHAKRQQLAQSGSLP